MFTKKIIGILCISMLLGTCQAEIIYSEVAPNPITRIEREKQAIEQVTAEEEDYVFHTEQNIRSACAIPNINPLLPVLKNRLQSSGEQTPTNVLTKDVEDREVAAIATELDKITELNQMSATLFCNLTRVLRSMSSDTLMKPEGQSIYSSLITLMGVQNVYSIENALENLHYVGQVMFQTINGATES